MKKQKKYMNFLNNIFGKKTGINLQQKNTRSKICCEHVQILCESTSLKTSVSPVIVQYRIIDKAIHTLLYYNTD